MRTDLFQVRGGTGGRSRKGCFFPSLSAFASYCSLRSRHFLSEEKNARAEPRAALMAARRNIAGISGASDESGMIGWGLASVAWVSFSRAVRASLLVRERQPSWA